MKLSRSGLLRYAFGAAIGVAALGAGAASWSAPNAAAGHEIAGTYAMEQVSVSETQAQMTLHVYLTNSQDAEISVTSAALESAATGESQDLSGAVTIAARSTSDFAHAVSISRDEYGSWRAGAHPLLVVKFTGADGTETVRTIALLPATTARAN